MSPIMLTAIADDDRVHEVVAAARTLADTGRLRPVFVHVARPARLAPMPVGFGLGTGAAATAALLATPAERHASLLEEADVWDDEAILLSGDPAAELNRLSEERDAALLVLGTHGRGAVAGAMLGSVSRRLARSPARPVLLVRPGSVPGTSGPVACAVDLADGDQPATVRRAACLAEWTDRPLILVHVLPMAHMAGVGGPVVAPVPLEPTVLDRAAALHRLEALAADLPVRDVDCVLLDPAPVVARLEAFSRGRRADLLVVGARRGGMLRTALEGSVSLGLLRRGSRPLVIVPAGG